MDIEEARKQLEELLDSELPICEYKLKHQEIAAMQILLNELDRLKKYEDIEWQEFNELAVANAELKKKSKVIDEMAEMINNHDIEEDVCKQMGKNRHCNDFIVSERNCINCIKEYFTNKVENVGE